MKTKMILLTMLVCPILLFGQTWDYPVKPGTEEWKKMDYNQKVKLSQPSFELTKKITTDDLLDICLRYPFNKDILLFNNPNIFFKKLFDNSIVWNEFINRKDAFIAFEQYYNRYPLEHIAEIKDTNIRNNERFNLYFLEKVVSETTFIDNLSTIERKNIAKIILDKHISKKNYPHEYNGFAYNSSLGALRKIIITEKKATKNIENFNKVTQYERFMNNYIDNEIIAHVQKFISQ